MLKYRIVRIFLEEKRETAKRKTKKAIALFLDLKKAFDTVYYEILIGKLAKHGITGIENN